MQSLNSNRTSLRWMGTTVSIAALALIGLAPANAQSVSHPEKKRIPKPGVTTTPIVPLSLTEKNARTKHNDPVFLSPIVVRSRPISAPIMLTRHDFDAPGVPLQGHIPGIVANAARVRQMDKEQELTITFALRPRNQAEMDDLVKRVYDPKDPLFHHFLTPAERIARFSPTREDFNRVVAFAQQRGLRVVDSSVDRQLVTTTGTVGQIENALGVQMSHYQAANGETFYAPEGEPHVPQSIAPLLFGIHNLSDTAKPHSLAIPRSALPEHAPNSGSGGPGGAPQPNDIGTWSNSGMPAAEVRKCYNLSYSINGAPITGAGQHVALVEFGGFYQQDITAYIWCNANTTWPTINLNAAPIQVHLMRGYDGGVNKDTPEVELDIEMLEAVTDGLSQIDVYEENYNGDMIQELNQILNDNTANQVSISYGIDENSNGVAYEASYVNVTEMMALQGQAIFVSSGDHGAYDNTPNLTVNMFAASPYVTGVGGTSLWINQNTFGDYGAFSYEYPWNHDGSATGGGISQVVAIPNYQSQYLALYEHLSSFNSPLSVINRNIPDVALDADPNTGYYVRIQGGDHEYGGTSASAPIWAAFWAQLNQARAINGIAPIGFANPALYTIASGANYNSDFHDVYGGDNGFFHAVVGYDCTTGLGSINGLNMLNDLLNYGAWSPTASLSIGQSSVMSGQPFPMTVTLDTQVPYNGSAIVTIAQDEGSYLSEVTSQTLTGGVTSTNFQVIAPDVLGSTQVSFTAYVRYFDSNGRQIGGNHWTNYASVAITPNAIASVNITPGFAFDGQYVTGTVTLKGAAAQNEVIDLFSSDPTNVSVPVLVTVPAGQTSVGFNIATKLPATLEQVTITAQPDGLAGLEYGTSVKGQFTIGPLLSDFTIAPATLHGGSTAKGVVTFTQGIPTDLTLRLKSTDPNVSMHSTVNVAAGQSSVTFSIPTKAVASNVTATIQLSDGYASKSATLTILAPTIKRFALSPATVVGPAQATATLTLASKAPKGGLAYQIVSSNPAVVTVPATVIVPASNTAAAFTVTAAKVTKSTTVTITVTDVVTGTPHKIKLKVNP